MMISLNVGRDFSEVERTFPNKDRSNSFLQHFMGLLLNSEHKVISQTEYNRSNILNFEGCDASLTKKKKVYFPLKEEMNHGALLGSFL